MEGAVCGKRPRLLRLVFRLGLFPYPIVKLVAPQALRLRVHFNDFLKGIVHHIRIDGVYLGVVGEELTQFPVIKDCLWRIKVSTFQVLAVLGQLPPSFAFFTAGGRWKKRPLLEELADRRGH